MPRKILGPVIGLHLKTTPAPAPASDPAAPTDPTAPAAPAKVDQAVTLDGLDAVNDAVHFTLAPLKGDGTDCPIAAVDVYAVPISGAVGTESATASPVPAGAGPDWFEAGGFPVGRSPIAEPTSGRLIVSVPIPMGQSFLQSVITYPE